MHVAYRHNIKELLKEIDVSDYDYEKAINRYKSISEFVNKSSLSQYNPEIFVQGSFKLGTAIKPITEDGSYDVDMVLVVTGLDKLDLSQNDFKKKVGYIIQNYVASNGMKTPAKDGKRCWTIDYVDEHNFHIDILPTLSDIQKNVLLYTNKDNTYYNFISEFWDVSNPKEYYLWFIKHSNFEYVKKLHAKQLQMNVEIIPDYKIKTHLQRVVQIFKRHAEVMFEDNIEFKPSSIIITTLCAKAYSKIQTPELYFEDLLKEIAKGLMNELDFLDGKYCVLNPVYPAENLSQKWDDDNYYQQFAKWVNQLKFDLNTEKGIAKRAEEFNLLKRSLFRNNTSSALQKSLELLPYHQKMKWENKIWKDVSIKTYIIDDNKRIIKRLVSGELIDKGLNLRFEAEAENLNLYDIYWQITNTGYEAQKCNQLRGDFYESELQSGSKIRIENTSYSGKHYVEAFIIDNNNCCVGRSAPFVVNIK